MGSHPLCHGCNICNHTFGSKKLQAIVTQQISILFRGQFPRNGKDEPAGKLGVPSSFHRFRRVPQGISVCVLRRRMGRQHDFLVDDFSLMTVILLFLVVLRKQPFAALIGGRSDSGTVFAPFDDNNIIVRTRHSVASFLPVSGQEKAGDLFRFPA